jgi:hypothetical protein
MNPEDGEQVITPAQLVRVSQGKVGQESGALRLRQQGGHRPSVCISQVDRSERSEREHAGASTACAAVPEDG